MCCLPSGTLAEGAGVQCRNYVVLGQQGGENENPSLPKCLEGSKNSSSSLAVFYVEQVALNRHVSPQPRLLLLCLKRREMSRTKLGCKIAHNILAGWCAKTITQQGVRRLVTSQNPLRRSPARPPINVFVSGQALRNLLASGLG